ncbi:MAG: hypothetical protein PVG19_12155 [Desulfobacterales bacterium]|jgi:hypothetical protein
MVNHKRDFIVQAGPKALEIIRDEGLRPESLKVVAGAAGGPKWLVLYHLDRLLDLHFYPRCNRPVYFIGSSIGAWRFAALCQRDAASALDRFRDAYIHQRYEGVPNPADVTAESRRVMDDYVDSQGIDHILTNPDRRLAILAVKCRHFTACEDKGRMGLGLTGAVLANLISRSMLSYFFQRHLFGDDHNAIPLKMGGDLPFRQNPLNRRNFKEALLASGSIPLVMSGVRDIDGADVGVYRDGGMIDYHLDLPYRLNPSALVLMPHFAGKLIPGWLDKQLRWRRPTKANMAQVVMVAPSSDFVRRLPGAKIPDRTDFKTFFQKDGERFATWKRVVEMCRAPSEAFMESVESGRIREEVQPMEFI